MERYSPPDPEYSNWPCNMAASAWRCQPSAPAFTGIPPNQAAPVALQAALEALQDHSLEVRFVLYDRGSYNVFERALASLSAG